MNKKILDATVTVLFCMGLMITSNVPEVEAEESQMDAVIHAVEQRVIDVQDAAGEMKSDAEYTVTAGVCRILSENSFTAESGENTSIEKNEIYRVAVAEESAFDEAIQPNVTKMQQLEAAAETEESVVEAEAETTEYNNRWNITLTEEEIDLLARIVWLESCGEPVEGQQAVVEVIFNRMASELYPDTLYDVLSQKNPVQFCSWKNRDIAKPTDKEYQSIYEVLNGNTNILRNDTLYFSTEPLTSRLDVKIGGHSFCY